MRPLLMKILMVLVLAANDADYDDCSDIDNDIEDMYFRLESYWTYRFE